MVGMDLGTNNLNLTCKVSHVANLLIHNYFFVYLFITLLLLRGLEAESSTNIFPLYSYGITETYLNIVREKMTNTNEAICK